MWKLQGTNRSVLPLAHCLYVFSLYWWDGSERTVSMPTSGKSLHHPSPPRVSHSPFSQGLFSCSGLCLLPQHLPLTPFPEPNITQGTNGAVWTLTILFIFSVQRLQTFVLHSSLWAGSTPQSAVVRWIIFLLSNSKGRDSFCLNLPNVLSGFSLHPCPRYFHVLEITSEIRGYLTPSNCSICSIQCITAKYLCD